jgi:hypothetical protein
MLQKNDTSAYVVAVDTSQLATAVSYRRARLRSFTYCGLQSASEILVSTSVGLEERDKKRTSKGRRAQSEISSFGVSYCREDKAESGGRNPANR